MMTREKLAEIKARLAAATPGPWRGEVENERRGWHTVRAGRMYVLPVATVTHHMTVAAIHRADIARLTAELAERTTERDMARELNEARIKESFTAAPGEAWERLPVEDRLALLDALAEEAGERRRVAADPDTSAFTRASCKRLAGAWEAARAALMRRDTVTSKDKSAEEYAAALAAVERKAPSDKPGAACPGCHEDCLGWVVDSRPCDGGAQ